jgi:hypothetical protein
VFDNQTRPGGDFIEIATGPFCRIHGLISR